MMASGQKASGKAKCCVRCMALLNDRVCNCGVQHGLRDEKRQDLCKWCARKGKK